MRVRRPAGQILVAAMGCGLLAIVVAQGWIVTLSQPDNRKRNVHEQGAETMEREQLVLAAGLAWRRLGNAAWSNLLAHLHKPTGTILWYELRWW